MILVSTIVVVSILALAAVLFLVRGRAAAGKNVDSLTGLLCPIDVNAFRNLIDEREEAFLRERLSASDFRRIHRERMLAATQYVWGASRNAGVLIRLGEAARQSSDPAVNTAGERLQENAFRLRLYALQTLPRLYFSMVFPIASRAPHAVAEQYDYLTRQLVMLKCLQPPARGLSENRV